MKNFITSFLNVFLILTASFWLPFVYVVNALSGHESSKRVLLGEHFVLDRIKE